MKKLLVLSALTLPSLLFTECVKKHTGAAAPSPAAEVAEMQKKYTAPQIAEGKVIYTGSCQKCHQLYQPTDFSIKKWDKILPEMCGKAELTAEQAGKVRAWVITNTNQS